MKKLLSVLIAAIMALTISATGFVEVFAAEMPKENSVEALSDVGQSDALTSEGSNSEEDTTEPTAPIENYPKITGFTPVSNGVRVSWTAYAGAAKYRLFVLSGSTWKKLGDTATLSYTHTAPVNSTTYTYTVRALDSKNNYISGYNKQGYKNTFYAPPVISSITSTNGGVSITWNKSGGVSSYRIYRKTKGTSWSSIGVSSTASFVDQNVTSGTAYTYTVRCLDSDGKLISYYNQGKSITYVATPSITKIENTATGTKITWTNCAGAAKYRVFYLSSSKTWKALATTTSTSYTNDKLKTGTSYTYTVRCLDASGNYVSGYDKTGTSYTFLTTPQITSIAATNSGIQISWGKLYGASGYRIYRKSNGKSWSSIGVSITNSYVDKNASRGTTYTYTVRCLDENGKLISYYNQGKDITYVQPPTITKFENTATGTTITWSKSAGAAKYRLYYVGSNNTWKAIGTTTSTSLTHENLKNGTTYRYTVRCLDSSGNYASGYKKEGVSNLFLAPPAISSISKASNGNLIKWNSIAGAAGYRLYRKTIGAKWSKLADITSGTSYVDTTAKTGVAYTYTLRCLDKNKNLISYYIANTKYYYNGSLANGKVNANGEAHYFLNGVFRTGFQTVSGKKYYFNSSGVPHKNGIVGSAKEGWYYADANGVCCESEEIRLAAEYMMKYCKGDTLDEKMKSGFLYMAKNFPYKRAYDHPKSAADIAPLAIDMFTNQKGNCFRYAASFACVAKIAGYRSRVVIGTTDGSPHGWTEVLVDGEWLICDPDAQIPAYHVPDYTPYMMKQHYWNLVPNVKCELVIEGSKAVWK